MENGNRISISLLKKKDINLFKQFIKKYWKKNHIFVKNQKLFDWQHKEKKYYLSTIAKKNKKIVGVQNYILFNHFDHNLKKKDAFLALWKSLEKESIGIGYRLFKAFIEIESPDFIGSVGFSEKTIKFHLWQGFQVGYMKHYVFVSPYKKKFKIAKISRKLNIKKIKLNKKFSFKKIDISNIKKIHINKLFHYQIPEKSTNYLINRYMKHPIYSYDLYALKKNNKIYAVVVLRKIKVKSESMIKIVDFIGSNNSFFMIKFLLNHLFAKYNYEYASIYVYGIPKIHIEKSGCINVNQTSNLIIPFHFEPFIKKNIDVACAFKSTNKAKVRIFVSDCDQDRPNIF